jgi:hypothetical protein
MGLEMYTQFCPSQQFISSVTYKPTMAERQLRSRSVSVTVLEAEDNSETLVGTDNRVEENPDTNFHTNLVENGNEIDNSNDKQLGIAGTSYESFIFPKKLNDLLTNIIYRFEGLNSKLAEKL